MLTIRNLKEYEYPPAGEDWIAVTQSPDRSVSIVVGLSRDRDSVYVHARVNSMERGKEVALAEADRLGLGTVYLISAGTLAD